jgi:hypothetical protein
MDPPNNKPIKGKDLMKRLLFATLLTISQAAFADTTHTKVMSALARLKSDFELAKRYVVADADGADVSYICQVLVLIDWSNPVLKSIQSAGDISVEVSEFQDNIYVNRQFMQVLSNTRAGIQKSSLDAINSRIQKKLWPDKPDNLTFENLEVSNADFMTSLANCSDEDYVDEVSQSLPPLDPTKLITASIALKDPGVGGGLNSMQTGDYMGIAPGADAIPIVSHTMTYADWIKSILNGKATKE